MSIAEKLYTQGFISYPRTETNIFPKEMNLGNIVQSQMVDQRWGGFANKIMNEWNGPHPRQGKKSDQVLRWKRDFRETLFFIYFDKYQTIKLGFRSFTPFLKVKYCTNQV